MKFETENKIKGEKVIKEFTLNRQTTFLHTELGLQSARR
jgi:hypothetical protein